MKIITFISIFFTFILCQAQYEFVKVHNEDFDTPNKRGFFFDLECQGDTCVSFNSVGGGYAKILTSTNNGKDWEVSFTFVGQFENGQSIHINGGGVENQFIYYTSIGGVITLSENSFTDFQVINTPITYSNSRIDNGHIINDTIYFTHSFDIFKKHIDDSEWGLLPTFDRKLIVDMKIDKQSNSIYCILNNIDDQSVEYELNERIFAFSRDMGYTWTYSKTGYDVRFITVNGEQIWLVGGEPNGNGKQRDDIIMLSINSGVDWEVSRFKLSENSGAGIHGLEMKDDKEGIAFGNNGNFLRTTNTGQSWERISINQEVDNVGFPPSIMVLDWNQLGEPLLGISNMGIYRGVLKTSVETESSVDLYPMIFNSSINVNIAESDIGSKIIIYSLDGSVVKQSVLTNLNTTIPLENLISGVYFANINDKYYRLLKQK